MKHTLKCKNTSSRKVEEQEIVMEDLIREAAEGKLPTLNKSTITALFNSKEFRTPVTDAEVESCFASTDK
jgi:hypothetical protein